MGISSSYITLDVTFQALQTYVFSFSKWWSLPIPAGSFSYSRKNTLRHDSCAYDMNACGIGVWNNHDISISVNISRRFFYLCKVFQAYDFYKGLCNEFWMIIIEWIEYIRYGCSIWFNLLWSQCDSFYNTTHAFLCMRAEEICISPYWSNNCWYCHGTT